ncbi:MAG: phage portal protein [Phycisphaerae bacterium]|nr:phage portal protein [Phycisphaerae bacterium]
MPFNLAIFHSDPNSPPLDEDFLAQQLSLAGAEQAVKFERLMSYYRNDLQDSAALPSRVDAGETARPYMQAQEFGLPPRITGFRHDTFGAIFGGDRVENIRRKEVVIENDIGWRIDTMLHYLFGPPVQIVSQADDPALREQIDQAQAAALAANGGPMFLRQMALFAHVYGFADVVVRMPSPTPLPRSGGGAASAAVGARSLIFELVEADRAIPILNAEDYRKCDYYVQHFRQRDNSVDAAGAERSLMVTEIIGPRAWQRYHDRELVAEGENPLGEIPVVHIQNLPRPFCYEGESEVERLTPMQDELNTRLSDRANRITFQSFKMYLGRGIDNFEDRPIAPGRMWSTDNPEAGIIEFGGDPGSPSESEHIDQVREAMDKISGVPPVAAGLVRDRLGNLSSGNALRITLSALLSKTAAKRAVYGAGLERLCELALTWLNAAGVLTTTPADRRVQIEWGPLGGDLLSHAND